MGAQRSSTPLGAWRAPPTPFFPRCAWRFAAHPDSANPSPLLPRPKLHNAQQAAGGAAPSYALLRYEYVPDIVERRGPHREAHLAGAQKKVGADGVCVSGGLGVCCLALGVRWC